LELEEVRNEINKIDEQLVELLVQRMDAVSKVTEIKIANNLDVLDSSREDIVLQRVEDMTKNPDYKSTIRATFSDIMKESRVYQNDKMGKGEIK
jgi:chorismate mutase